MVRRPHLSGTCPIADSSHSPLVVLQPNGGWPMPDDLRISGISAVGDMPWGSHVSLFYQTREDLLNSIVPYFRDGLNAGELCVWMPSDPRAEEEATDALRLEV